MHLKSRGIAGVRAAYYQEAGDYEKALPLYETYLKAPPKDADPTAIVQAKLNTAVLAEYSGKTQTAVNLYNQLATTTLAEEAKCGLERIAEAAARRQPASTNVPFKRLEPLVKLMG